LAGVGNREGGRDDTVRSVEYAWRKRLDFALETRREVLAGVRDGQGALYERINVAGGVACGKLTSVIRITEEVDNGVSGEEG
jgi:hypothetical protein